MKRINLYIAGLLLSSCFLGACEKDFLDKQPLDKISDATVWNDFALAQAYLNNIYTGLPNGFQRSYYMLESATDNADNTYQWTDAEKFNFGDYNPSNFPTFGVPWSVDGLESWSEGPWNMYYNYIRRANIFLSRVDEVPGDKAQIDRMKGEAKFLRALFYHELSRLYGGVPIVTEALGVENLEAMLTPRNTYEETVTFIVNELTEAASLLPDTRYLGRAVQTSALALKGRVLLYAGSPQFNNGSFNTARMAESAAASKAVIDKGTYSLFPNYGNMFMAANNNNIEVIFDNQYKQGIRGHYVDQFNTPIELGGGWGGTSPTQNLVDKYEMTDGKFYNESPLYSPTQPYQNRDPRFYATVFHDGSKWGDVTIQTRVGGLNGIDGGVNGTNGDATKTGYYMRKFLDPANTNNLYLGGGSSYNNWIIIRLAEVLLNYAEAQNEAVGPDATVYDAVNMVRARPGVNLPPVPAGLSKEAMRERIRHEREIELAFEEHRFYDVRRWNIAEQVLNGPIYGFRIGPNGEVTGGPAGKPYGRFVVETRIFQPKHNLMPIPQKERDKNPKLEQNPGW
jgi:hypothetical protein